MGELSGKNVVLGVSGGIAAYKAAELCRLLVKAGAGVRVVMTDAATKFVAPLTFQTLSNGPVATSLVDADEEARIGHIQIADRADLIVVAPATADTIARFAAGRADDLLSAVVLASRAPVLLAPAMNVNMWENPLTQANVARLLAVEALATAGGGPRFSVVGPDAGDLACGWQGAGRLVEPDGILAAAMRRLAPQDLAGRRIVVTAGPTVEPIDDVRVIANRSSGKMGFALAEVAARRGAQVTLIAGPVSVPAALQTALVSLGVTRVDVETAEEMRAALGTAVAGTDALVMAAAVADFRPARRVPGKMSRRSRAEAGASGWALPLVANPDVLAELGQSFARAAARGGGAARRPLLIGFAAERGPFSDRLELETRARTKLLEKKCDVVVANEVGAPGTGFGADDNAVTLVFADGAVEPLGRAPKRELASAIWDRLAGRLLAGAAVAAARTARAAGEGGRRPAAVRPARSRPRRARGERA